MRVHLDCLGVTSDTSRTQLELALRQRLLRSYAAHPDLSLIVVFCFHWSARQAPQDCDLAHVSERVGDGPLKEFFHGRLQGLARSQVVIEPLQRGEEALYFFFPCQRLRIAPRLLAGRD